MRSLARGARTATVETALTLGAVLGVVCLLAAVAAVALGVKPLLFRSGSMEPEIGTGALALSRTVPASDVAVGDVVSVTSPDGVRITHRVVSVTPIDGDPEARSLVLRGDANTVDDAQPYVVEDVDRVGWHVERLGYAVAWLSTPGASFAGGILAVGLLVVAFRRRRAEGARRATGTAPAPGGGRRRNDVPVETGRVSLRAAGTTLLVATACVVGLGAARPTTAAFTDNATATATFSALTLTAPATLTCFDSTGNGVTLSWPHVNAAYDYQMRFYAQNSPTAAGTKNVVASVAVGATQNGIVVPSDLTGSLLGANMTARVFSVPKGSFATWSSVTGPSTPIRSTLLNGNVRCGNT